MTDMLWLRVDGYPAGCLATADQLSALARRLDDASTVLTRDSHVPTADLDGLAADAFRAKAAELAEPTVRAAADTEGLAKALRELGRDLADAEESMDRIAAAARPHLRVLPDRVLAPERPRSFLEPEVVKAWEVFDLLERAHADARAREQRAQDDWRAAVAHFTSDGRTPLLAGIAWPVEHHPQVGPHIRER